MDTVDGKTPLTVKFSIKEWIALISLFISAIGSIVTFHYMNQRDKEEIRQQVVDLEKQHNEDIRKLDDKWQIRMMETFSNFQKEYIRSLKKP